VRSKPAQTIRDVVEGIPLSQKSLLLFTLAMTLVATTLVAMPWLGQWAVVDAAAFETLERLAANAARPAQPADLANLTQPETLGAAEDDATKPESPPDGALRIDARDFAALRAAGGFPAAALGALEDDPERQFQREALSVDAGRVYRVAIAHRDEAGALTALTLAQSLTTRPQGRLLVLRVFTVAAAFLAAAVAALAFYFIVNRLVLSPVRELSSTAARVAAGDLSARTNIETGDEFESFAEVFNDMLATLERQQAELRGAEESLNLQVAELEEANRALNEASRLKSDFLATVSHELRTPLNSIIGFADLLLSIAQKEAPATDGVVRTDPDRYAKRTRYLQNILTAGRSLLEMINDLLEMARIEAGKVDLHVSAMSVGAACEGLLAMIRPQAQRKSLELVFTACPGDSAGPVIVTDPRKFQQIIFNFLSNAVKFTPDRGRVELRVERLTAADEPQIRVSVIDTGPGIPPESHASIFEKFTQLDAGHERQQQGAGLGLAICRELGSLIQGEIQLESAAGRGSMFSLIVPEKMDPQVAADAALRTAGVAASRPLVPAEHRVEGSTGGRDATARDDRTLSAAADGSPDSGEPGDAPERPAVRTTDGE
jgi:signal transduction histidine kinase